MISDKCSKKKLKENTGQDEGSELRTVEQVTILSRMTSTGLKEKVVSGDVSSFISKPWRRGENEPCRFLEESALCKGSELGPWLTCW